MSYSQPAGDTNFDDEPPLLEGECNVLYILCPPCISQLEYRFGSTRIDSFNITNVVGWFYQINQFS